ncbi:MAG: cytochrome-c peroxidase [Flavobacteriales bacterium]|nr:cytochrome-c peroxidase [Flavobacteriales bacterium]
MNNRLNICILLSIFLLALWSCKKEDTEEDSPIEQGNHPTLPSTLFNYEDLDLPDHFFENGFIGSFQSSLELIDNTPDDNPTTDEGATLGRVLFYDKELSKNRTISCASCHQQEYGFSDPERFSIGFEEGLTGRHSMGLANAAYYGRGRFFWDERAETLEDQVLMPIQDGVEMGLTLDTVIERISAKAYYEALFVDAFGDETVTQDRIAAALSQFVRSMVSYRSKYDDGRSQVDDPYEPFPNFTPQENLGKNLFLGPMDQGGVGCIDCHSTEGFVNIAVGPLSNGIDGPQEAEDPGHYVVTSNPNDLNTFKSPSLKNIAIRPPYMHDGRFNDLDEVIEHYNSGIQDHPNLNFSLLDSQGAPVRMNLTETEKGALKAFMETLTDIPMLNDEKFSDPFE